MRGENLREGKKAEGLRYSFRLKGKLVEIKTDWKEHKNLYLPVQKHTSRVIRLTTFPYPPVIGDAVVSNLKGVEIGVRTADCAPVVALGEEWFGVAHVGWRGLLSGILGNFIEVLSKYEPVENLFIFIGPCAKACCYEVGEEFTDLFPGHIEEREGRLFMDLQRAVESDLNRLGVKTIGLYEHCTICSDIFPSYRRERTGKRFLTSIRTSGAGTSQIR